MGELSSNVARCGQSLVKRLDGEIVGITISADGIPAMAARHNVLAGRVRSREGEKPGVRSYMARCLGCAASAEITMIEGEEPLVESPPSRPGGTCLDRGFWQACKNSSPDLVPIADGLQCPV